MTDIINIIKKSGHKKYSKLMQVLQVNLITETLNY